MRHTLLGLETESGYSVAALKQALCSQRWANHLPENAATLVRGCYRNEALRRDECEQPFRRLEQLVLTEISLSLDVGVDELLREVHAANGLDAAAC